MEATRNVKVRKNYLDHIRVLSMLSVVLIHIFVTARTDFPNHTEFEEILTYICSGTLHYCVPLFFMITGTLFLQTSKKIDLKVLYKKYIIKYVLVLLIFGWGFAFLEELLKSGLNFSTVINSFINMLQGKTWDHMWYLYTLVGIIMVLPIIKLIVDNDTEKNCLIIYIIGLLVVFSSILPTIEKITGFKLGIVFPIQSVYIVYMLLGYLLDKKQYYKKLYNIIIITICAVIVVVANVFSVKMNMESLRALSAYTSPITMLMSIAIFSLIKQAHINKEKAIKIILYLSESSFGVYILHMFWINIIYKFLKINIFGEYLVLKSLGLYIVVVVLSVLSTRIIKRIPILKSLI